MLIIATYDNKEEIELGFQLYFIEERGYALNYWSFRLYDQTQIKNIIPGDLVELQV